MAQQINGDFILSHGETFTRCPYNLAHEITNARIIVHMDKCRRNYVKEMKAKGKAPEMKQCRFNWLHQVPAPEIEYHENRCPDQSNVIDAIRYHQSDEFRMKQEEEKKRKESADDTDDHGRHHHHRHRDDDKDRHSSSHKKKHSKKHDVKPKVDDNPWGEAAEDWEAESNGYEPGYDPNVKLAHDIVLYTPRGMSKSERKAFREEQKQRAAQASFPVPEVDVKPFSKLEVREVKPEFAKPAPPPAVVVKSDPIVWEVEEKEEGEISEEEFYGEDPFS